MTELTDVAATDEQPADTGPATLAALLGDSDLAREPALGNYLGGDVATLAKGFVSAQKMVGADPNRFVKLPAVPLGDEAGAAEWDAVFNRLGRPDSPEKYTLPENIKADPDGYGLNAETMKGLGDAFYKAGLNDRQASAILAWYGQFAEAAKAQAEQQSAQSQEQREQALAGLKKELGGAYDAHINSARRVIQEAGDEAGGFVELLNETGLGDDPRVIKFFAALGKGFREDGGDTSSGGRFNNALTPAQARARIAELKADTGFVTRWMSAEAVGHAEAVAEMDKLNRWAFPE